jgi:hypothetical protein
VPIGGTCVQSANGLPSWSFAAASLSVTALSLVKENPSSDAIAKDGEKSSPHSTSPHASKRGIDTRWWIDVRTHIPKRQSDDIPHPPTYDAG